MRRTVGSLPCSAFVIAVGWLLAASGCRPEADTSAPEPKTGVGRLPVATAGGGDGVETGVLAHELRIFDAKGRERELGSMLDELAKHDVVLLGETHLDDATHRFEHAVLEGLAKRRDGKVVLSMEMFERDVQGVLDRYLTAEIDESTFLAEARPWGNYRPDYRPLVETARARKLPVIAANTPRSLLRKAAQGAAGYSEARAEHPEWLPEQIFPASDDYWARVDRTIRGHGPPGGGDRTYTVQNLWDNTMADSIVRARAAHDDHVVLHVVGAFHVEHHDGTAAQLRRRAHRRGLWLDAAQSSLEIHTIAGHRGPLTASVHNYIVRRYAAFFALRRSLLSAAAQLTPDLRQVLARNPDPCVRSLAQGAEARA